MELILIIILLILLFGGGFGNYSGGYYSRRGIMASADTRSYSDRRSDRMAARWWRIPGRLLSPGDPALLRLNRRPCAVREKGYSPEDLRPTHLNAGIRVARRTPTRVRRRC